MSDRNGPDGLCVPIDDHDYPPLRLPPRETQSLHLVTKEANERLRRRAAAWKAVAKRWRDIADNWERRAEMRMETLEALYVGRQLDAEQRRLDCDSCFMRRKEVSE